MRNVSEKSCRKNQNTFFVEYNFFSENPAVCEIVLKNMVEPCSMAHALWMLDN
jgi:hypothetical protein